MNTSLTHNISIGPNRPRLPLTLMPVPRGFEATYPTPAGHLSYRKYWAETVTEALAEAKADARHDWSH